MEGPAAVGPSIARRLCLERAQEPSLGEPEQEHALELEQEQGLSYLPFHSRQH